MRKIDIHCHIIPGIDDGASTAKESLQMLQSAIRQDVKAIIATPHYSAYFKNGTPAQVQGCCQMLEQWIHKNLTEDFRIFPGREILYSTDTVRELQEGILSTMADSSYVLIEFMPDVPFSYLFRAVRELTAVGYRPILAHVERYGVLRQKGKTEELTDAGAYLQMNYRHIGGKWYDDTTRWCRNMLKEEQISFLGTDMHNMKNRCPRTQEAEVWMTKHLNERYLCEVLYENAAKLLSNTRI